MRTRTIVFVVAVLASSSLTTHSGVFAQQPPPGGQAATPAQPSRAEQAKLTEVWEPVPKVVTPGATPEAPPSDAIVLFDGKNLDEWVAVKDKSPATWAVADGILTVDKKTGNIETKRAFKNYQI